MSAANDGCSIFFLPARSLAAAEMLARRRTLELAFVGMPNMPQVPTVWMARTDDQIAVFNYGE